MLYLITDSKCASVLSDTCSFWLFICSPLYQLLHRSVWLFNKLASTFSVRFGLSCRWFASSFLFDDVSGAFWGMIFSFLFMTFSFNWPRRERSACTVLDLPIRPSNFPFTLFFHNIFLLYPTHNCVSYSSFVYSFPIAFRCLLSTSMSFNIRHRVFSASVDLSPRVCSQNLDLTSFYLISCPRLHNSFKILFSSAVHLLL